MVSPTTRRKISDICNTVSSYTRSGLWLGAKGVYALSVTTLFIGVPFSLLVADDMMLAEQEKEMRMREMGNEVGLIDFLQSLSPIRWHCPLGTPIWGSFVSYHLKYIICFSNLSESQYISLCFEALLTAF